MPHILYVVHLQNVYLDEAREKMGGITGYDFVKVNTLALFDYIDNTRLYHLVQLGEETDEVKMAKDTLVVSSSDSRTYTSWRT
ncbi:hypothetical protein PTQ24_000101 [Salmonella phage KKP_3822]|uniref:Uncharacterized protein n=1 Tax=Salmonella phage KKP_3822 TaxID=3027681 RepID=A0AAX4NF09_9CAUD